MKKTILIIVVILVLGGIGAYFYVFHKPHRDMANESAALKINAPELVDAYQHSQQEANITYLDKVVAVQGVVMEKGDHHLKLEGGVYCEMHADADISGVQEGDDVLLKGRIVGYDDLFSEVRMDNVVMQ